MSIRETARFIGRGPEMAVLRGALGDALAGHGQLVLLSGEAGIGKTRIAEDLATYAVQRGARALWGRCCEEEGAPALWPWIQVLRSALGGSDPAAVTELFDAVPPELAQRLPILRDRLPLTPPPSFDSPEARFRVFDGVTRLLDALSRQTPLVLLVDDLQGADRLSLLLLQFVARQLREMRLLVVGTFRDGVVDCEHSLHDAVAELSRATGTERLQLRGWSAGEVAQFVETSVAVRPTAAWVAELHARTEGNPLFVSEYMRLLLAESGHAESPRQSCTALGPVPDTVRAVIARRLAPLPARCHDVLQVAAVIGREFSVQRLVSVLLRTGASAAAAKADDTTTADSVDIAAGAGIVNALPDSSQRYRFAHALIRETLYDAIGAGQRARLHEQVGMVIEGEPDSEARLAELAYHFSAAGTVEGNRKALAYTRSAAEQATRLLAYEEAARQYEAALAALDRGVAGLSGAGVEAQRCELLLALGQTHAKAGERDRSRKTFRRAIEIARGLGLTEQLATAAVGFAGLSVEASAVDHDVIATLDEALAALGSPESALAARVMARLSQELRLPAFEDRRTALAEQALDIARRSGDSQALGEALVARHVALRGPGHAAQRLALSTELVQLGRRTGNLEVAGWGHGFRNADCMELGDIAAAEEDGEACGRLGERLRQPLFLWERGLFRGMRALLEGRLEEGERLAQEAAAIGLPVDPDAEGLFGLQLLILRTEQGRLGEVETALREFVEQYPRMPAWRAVLAAAYAELDRRVETHREFERLAAQNFADIPRDGGWLPGVAALAETCAFLGDEPRAALLYDLLLPAAPYHVVVQSAVWKGSVTYYLGLLAATLRRWECASQHFEAASDAHRRLGAAPWLARTLYAYARMLLARGVDSQRQRADRMLADARAMAREIGMPVLMKRVRALQKECREAAVSDGRAELSPAPEPEPASERDTGVFRRDGDFWTVAYAGTVVRLKDTKGLRYLASLLRHPGCEFLVLDLIHVSNGAAAVAGSYLPAAKPEPVVDARGRQAYKERLLELREALAVAEVNNDIGGADRMRAEMEMLAAHLRCAFCLGGRDRRAGSDIERARTAVSKRIHAEIKRIHALLPALGRHLVATLRTGYFCAYEPGRDRVVTWDV